MSATVPDVLPMLGRGKHRSPRRGACFMELASFLAGEPWSDSPSCTDPALAHLARLVNDFTSDQARPRLAPLIPAVIGVRDLPTGFHDDVALIAAAHALPVASFDRQRGLAVGVLRVLGELDAYRTQAAPELRAAAREALAYVPGAERWAREFAARIGSGSADRSSAAAMVEVAVRGIADACVADPEGRLRDLLSEVVDYARRRAGEQEHEPEALRAADWSRVVRAAG